MNKEGKDKVSPGESITLPPQTHSAPMRGHGRVVAALITCATLVDSALFVIRSLVSFSNDLAVLLQLSLISLGAAVILLFIARERERWSFSQWLYRILLFVNVVVLTLGLLGSISVLFIGY